MRTLLLLLVLACFVPNAAAKCGAKFYVFSGSVIDSNGAPVAKALVGVSWTESSVPNGPAMTLTDELGNYSIPIRFDTFSRHSIFSGDECRARLSRASVMAYTDTHRSQRELIDIGSSYQIAVPSLQVSRTIDFEPVWPDEIGD